MRRIGYLIAIVLISGSLLGAQPQRVTPRDSPNAVCTTYPCASKSYDFANSALFAAIQQYAEDFALWLLGEKNVESYGGFAEAITAIGSSTETLHITSSQTVGSNVTVPANVSLKFTKAGQLSVNSGITVTINGPLESPLKQIFSGSGTVSFGSGSIAQVYPQWWGAKGDGLTDDTAVFTSAMANGGLVYAPSGTYIVQINIFQSNTWLLGAGRGKTIFKAKTDLNNSVITNTAGISNIKLSGFSIDGNQANQSVQPTFGANGVGLIDATRVTIEDIEIYDTRTNGIRGRKLTHSKLINNYFHNIGKPTISASAIEVNADSSANASHNIVISGNNVDTITGTGNGIFVTSDSVIGLVRDVVISNNTITGATDEGIEAQHTTNVIIVNNKVKSSGSVGIYYRESTDGVIANNLLDGGADGINLDTVATNHVQRVSIIGNTIINFTTDAVNGTGIKLHGTTTWRIKDVIVSGNVIDNCTPDGIEVDDADRTDVHSNHIRGSTNQMTFFGTLTDVRVFSNSGYNPVGISTISPGASPYTYTAGSSPETIYVYGGTVSDVSIGGSTVATVSPTQVELPPNTAVVITYSSVPTVKKYTH